MSSLEIGVGFIGLAFLWVAMAHLLDAKQEFAKLIFTGMAFVNGIMSYFVIGIVADSQGLGSARQIIDVMGGISAVIFLVWFIWLIIKFMRSGADYMGKMGV